MSKPDKDIDEAVELALLALVLYVRKTGFDLSRILSMQSQQLVGKPLTTRRECVSLLLPFLLAPKHYPARAPVDAYAVEATVWVLGWCASLLKYSESEPAMADFVKTFEQDFRAGFAVGLEQRKVIQ